MPGWGEDHRGGTVEKLARRAGADARRRLYDLLTYHTAPPACLQCARWRVRTPLRKPSEVGGTPGRPDPIA